ncbi:FecR family protein [Mangrovibacterium diazotrophicum]|uniref:FecR family protein n=1 Tax=Mangrovibacterium diazotrophicum TaxID=1261403 RepID=A0A419VYN6_9BACT|nr:FecR domain-containing protein [Mangrovibacterium diazotrophicum]RKD88170.1 FecR family protein [Mangrovibacterium diazotrophicum]
MTKELLDKFLNDQCSPEELEQVKNWLSKFDSADEKEKLVYEDWKSFDLPDIEFGADENLKFNRLLDNIHSKLNKTQRVARTRNVSRFIGWATKAAAILFIPVLSILCYTVYNQVKQPSSLADMMVDSVEVSAPVGSITTVKLSDGTTVHLNYGSKISYPRIFTGKKRELKLKGEGFFEVAHNPEKPFIVEANGLNVKVLGTKFNVQAYPGQNVVSTTLVEGKVELEHATGQGSAKQLGAMKPGQHVEYFINSGKIESTIGNTGKYIGWKDGLLMFENSDIEEVVDRLGRKFNVDFVVDDDLRDLTYTVTFIDEPLSQILELMKEITPIRYRISPRIKLPDGSFSKQTITINKR